MILTSNIFTLKNTRSNLDLGIHYVFGPATRIKNAENHLDLILICLKAKRH